MKLVRALFLFITVSSSVVTFAGDKNGSVKIVASRDVPLQRTGFYPAKIHSQCTTAALLARTCWKVWAAASQTFDKRAKNLKVLVNVTIPSSSSNDFTYAALVFAIDGEVTQIPATDWTGSDPYIYGRTATIEDESLARKLARATEVWVTVLLENRISVKLDPKQIAGISAVVNAYDSLDPQR